MGNIISQPEVWPYAIDFEMHQYSECRQNQILTLAIDPSYRHTGLYFGLSQGTYTTSIPTDKSMTRADALIYLNESISKFLSAFISMPKLVIFEQYAFNATGNARTVSIEAGAMCRQAVWDWGIPIVEIPSTTWKKIVVGKGNASKKEVKDYMKDVYNLEFASQDECDAFCMYLATQLDESLVSREKILTL